MNCRRPPATLFRRLTAPIRAFIRVDLDMTQQALRLAPQATLLFMCAPSLFLLWVLDETEATINDLRRLLSPKR
jgi:hypothetical protein